MRSADGRRRRREDRRIVRQGEDIGAGTIPTVVLYHLIAREEKDEVARRYVERYRDARRRLEEDDYR